MIFLGLQLYLLPGIYVFSITLKAVRTNTDNKSSIKKFELWPVGTTRKAVMINRKSYVHAQAEDQSIRIGKHNSSNGYINYNWYREETTLMNFKF